MSAAIVVFGIVAAVAAAARSTWSPCGQSMISQLTPLGEASRGNRYRNSATYYIVGAITGGITLGVLTAALALGVDALDLSTSTAVALVAGAALLGALIDTGALGIAPPFLRRQVNELWLNRYRSWVYAGGFGWQIGTGITTYIMTAAVFVTIAIAALTASPVAAFGIALTFATVRGLAVLLAVHARTPAALISLHRRFDAWGEPVRRAVIAAQVVIGAAALVVVVSPIAGAAVLLAAAALAWRAWAPTRAQRASSSVPAEVVSGR
jgi:hypothetical protein